jgi:hypothetical protein
VLRSRKDFLMRVCWRRMRDHESVWRYWSELYVEIARVKPT